MYYKSYKLILLVMFVCSMYPWFVWNISGIYIIIIGFLVSTLFYLKNIRQFKLRRANALTSGLLIISFISYSFGFGFNGAVEQYFILFSLLLLINLNEEIKTDIFNYITNGLALLLFISLIFYILYFFELKLPFELIKSEKLGYEAINYYWFLITPGFDEFYRFRSIFAEPGHLSMGLIPLLYANRYKISNKFVLVLFVCELLTLSLAGYIAMTISLVILSLSGKFENRYSRRILLFFAFFAAVILSCTNEESIAYKAVISRLEFNQSRGTIEGNNRTTENVDAYFDIFTKSPDLLIGVDGIKSEELFKEGGNAGYKVFLIRFGLITAAVTFLCYFQLAFVLRNKSAYGLFVIMFLLLLQNSYPFWFAVFLGYALGVSKLFSDENASIQKLKTQP